MADIIWLASYPKSGNTWTRVFLTNYLRDELDNGNLNDLEGGPIASSRQLFDLAVGIEASCLLPSEVMNLRPAVYRVLARDNHNLLFIKTHDAWMRTPAGDPLFPADVTRGVVYIVRNPLDVAVSASHHYGRPLDEMINQLCDETYTLSRPNYGLAEQLPQRVRSWSGHVCSWLNESGLPIYVMQYEMMLADPHTVFGGLVRFAGLDYNEQRLNEAIAASRFESLQEQEQAKGFRERPLRASAPFFRSGRSGDWREVLSSADVNAIVAAHSTTMARFGYVDKSGRPT
ncbi:MAG: sulfotransferase domain-containing protein [Caldilineaceae bacterium]|nr:sulfotransferase domain-containing protein [Caldilineaceae bacterium]